MAEAEPKKVEFLSVPVLAVFVLYSSQHIHSLTRACMQGRTGCARYWSVVIADCCLLQATVAGAAFAVVAPCAS